MEIEDKTQDSDPSMNRRLDHQEELSKHEREVSDNYSDGFTPSFVELEEDKKEEESPVNKIVFRSSRFFLNFEIGVLLFMFITLYFVIVLITGFLASTNLFDGGLFVLNLVLLIVLIIIFGWTAFWSHQKWKNTYYEIQPGVISKRWGVLDKQVRTLKFDNTSIITLSQGILGRRFDYGDVYIKSATEDDLALYKIPKPGQKLQILQDFIKQIEGDPLIVN